MRYLPCFRSVTPEKGRLLRMGRPRHRNEQRLGRSGKSAIFRNGAGILFRISRLRFEAIAAINELESMADQDRREAPSDMAARGLALG